MAGKIYESDEEYRLRVIRDNETRKALSVLFVQLGTALAAGGVVQVYTSGWADDPYVGLWFLVAIALIFIGVRFLRSLQAES